jgi:hypothetical protein
MVCELAFAGFRTLGMTTTSLPTISPAAERMRRHRERRRNQMRCFIVELRETEIDALVRRGLLNKETRNNAGAVINALYIFFDHTLGSTR